MTSAFSWQNSMSLCPASFHYSKAKFACYPRCFLISYFCIPVRSMDQYYFRKMNQEVHFLLLKECFVGQVLFLTYMTARIYWRSIQIRSSVRKFFIVLFSAIQTLKFEGGSCQEAFYSWKAHPLSMPQMLTRSKKQWLPGFCLEKIPVYQGAMQVGQTELYFYS